MTVSLVYHNSEAHCAKFLVFIREGFALTGPEICPLKCLSSRIFLAALMKVPVEQHSPPYFLPLENLEPEAFVPVKFPVYLTPVGAASVQLSGRLFSVNSPKKGSNLNIAGKLLATDGCWERRSQLSSIMWPLPN